MSLEKAIEVNHVYKKYTLYQNNKERLKDLLTPKKVGEDFYALSDVSFSAEKGDVVGFVGINGSGKSTLSNIVAGIIPAASGDITVNGQTSLIAVSTGLKGELTGRDNIELKLLMLGFSMPQIKQLEPGIIEFSELGKFIDQPVKSYSSGMKSRLGFSISVNVDPDVLIIDEALSVGDKAFAEKSFQKMMEFKTLGKTMIFVSHSLGQMRQFCEKILWLEYGRVKDFGPMEETLPKYEAFLEFWKKLDQAERERYKQAAMDGTGTDEWDADYMENIAPSNKFQEVSISRLGHIKGGESYFVTDSQDVINEAEGHSTDPYKHTVYSIKKQADYKNERYFLLSTEPSAQTGVIGWFKDDDITTRQHVEIDQDPKQMWLIGRGNAYDRPWGGENNRVINGLSDLTNKPFNVNKTEKVGKSLWYRGRVNDADVWIHHNNLTDQPE